MNKASLFAIANYSQINFQKEPQFNRLWDSDRIAAQNCGVTASLPGR